MSGNESSQPLSQRWSVSEAGIVGQVRLVADSLKHAGHECLVLAADDVAELCALLESAKPDAIFNCCESFRGRSDREMNLAALFELFDVPCTGSSAVTLGLALNKGVAKDLLRANGVPTPPYAVVRRLSELPLAEGLTWPLIVKPLSEDASIGIDTESVTQTPGELRRRLRFVLDTMRQPALVEEFIDGREFGVAFLPGSSRGQLATLPISEIDFGGLAPGLPRILTYQAKWEEGTHEYHATVPQCPAMVDPRTRKRLRTIAVAAARALGLAGYGRVDIRVRARDDEPFVIDVNPNPDLNSDAGFMRAARASGRTDAGTICEILDRATEHFGQSARSVTPAESSRERENEAPETSAPVLRLRAR